MHPPLTSVQNVISATKQWSQMRLFSEPHSQLRDCQYLVCMYSISEPDLKKRQDVLKQIQEKCDRWNSSKANIGLCQAYTAFDSVYHQMFLYIDDMTELKKSLNTAP